MNMNSVGGFGATSANQGNTAEEILRTLPEGSNQELLLAATEAAHETLFLQATGGQSLREMLAEAIQAVTQESGDIPASGGCVNLTAKWMATHYREVFDTLVRHLSTKMPKSRDLCVVEDHVQRHITDLIRKDRLAPLLTKGGDPKLSVLRVWSYQSAVTELRRWGTDASLRASRNVKTGREVEQGKAWHTVQLANTAREIIQDEGESRDLYDPNGETPEDAADKNAHLSRVRKALVKMGRPELVPVMNGLLEGQSLADLRGVYGATADQLGSVINALRV
jgi:hypothetical protein